MGWFWLFLWVWLLFALLFFLLFGQHDFVQWWIWHNSCQKKPRPIYMTHVTLHCVYVCEHCLMIFMLQRRGCVSLFLYEAALYCTDWAWLDGHCNSLNPSFAWPSACVRSQKTSTAIEGYDLPPTEGRSYNINIFCLLCCTWKELLDILGELFPFLLRIRGEDQD